MGVWSLQVVIGQRKAPLPWSLEFKFAPLNAITNTANTSKKKADLSTWKNSISYFQLWQKNVTVIDSLMITVGLSDFVCFSFMLEKVILLILMWLNLIKPIYIVLIFFLLKYQIFASILPMPYFSQELCEFEHWNNITNCPLESPLGLFCWLSSSTCSVRILSLNLVLVPPLYSSGAPLLFQGCKTYRNNLQFSHKCSNRRGSAVLSFWVLSGLKFTS